MAKERGELWHTIRGPVLSILTAAVIAAMSFALAYSGKQQAIKDDIRDHERRITSMEASFKEYCKDRQERDEKLAESLGEIRNELKNINRNIRRNGQ